MQALTAATLALSFLTSTPAAAARQDDGRAGTPVGVEERLPAQAATAPAQDFSELTMTLRSGQTVEVRRGREIVRGRVLGVTQTGLELEADGQKLMLAARDVTAVDALRRQTTRGAIIGALAGAGATFVMILIARAQCGDSCEDDSTPAIVVAATAFYAGIGAGAGALLGSRVHHRDPLYRRSVMPAVRVAPRGGVSIAYGVRF